MLVHPFNPHVMMELNFNDGIWFNFKCTFFAREPGAVQQFSHLLAANRLKQCPKLKRLALQGYLAHKKHPPPRTLQ